MWKDIWPTWQHGIFSAELTLILPPPTPTFPISILIYPFFISLELVVYPLFWINARCVLLMKYPKNVEDFAAPIFLVAPTTLVKRLPKRGSKGKKPFTIIPKILRILFHEGALISPAQQVLGGEQFSHLKAQVAPRDAILSEGLLWLLWSWWSRNSGCRVMQLIPWS